MYRYHVFFHQVLHQFFILGANQRPKRDNADKLSLSVNDITGIDGFFIHACPLDLLHGNIYGHAASEFHKLNSHQTSGGIFRIVQKSVDEGAGFRVGVAQHLFYQIGRCFFQKVHRIIQEHFVYDVAHFFICNGMNDMLLGVAVHIGKYFRCHVLGQQSENKKLFFRRQFLEVFRQVGGVFLVQFLF